MWFSQDQTRLPPMPTLGYKIDITVVGSEVGNWFGLKKKRIRSSNFSNLR